MGGACAVGGLAETLLYLNQPFPLLSLPSETTCRALSSQSLPSRMEGDRPFQNHGRGGVCVGHYLPFIVYPHVQQLVLHVLEGQTMHRNNVLGESHSWRRLHARHYGIVTPFFGYCSEIVQPRRPAVKSKCRPKIPSLSQIPTTHPSARPDHSAHVKQPHRCHIFQ